MILVCKNRSTVFSEKEICFFLQQISSCIQGRYLNYDSSDTTGKYLLFSQNFLLLLFGAFFLLTYPLYPFLENSGSTKCIMSAKYGSLNCLLLIFMPFQFHVSLLFPGNFDRTKHIIFGVSRKFQFGPNVNFSHFSRKL